ncbi:MAG TPA: FxsA family protein [Candidatus Omnitrophota bacterium]|nr:FxsA family protein [Candidatus Omnitrophota bacterium]
MIILFTVLPALELALLIHVGSHIGSLNTILLIIMTGVFGAHLARLQGFIVVRNIQTSLERGEMPTEDMLDGVLILIGGILLLTPGFITDSLGFLFLIPIARKPIKYWVRKKIEFRIFGQTANKRRPSAHGPTFVNGAEDAEFRE